MCGISGILAADAREYPRDAVETMSRVLRHRGPDDCGYVFWDGSSAPVRGRNPLVPNGARLGIAHRRLSIIDLTSNGWQPMTSADGRYDLVFNGEIYNYLELRRELERTGAVFRSTSDTEVLLFAWARWGRTALDRLTGMYAFAVVDWQARRLMLVRDCFGIKPLYYAAWTRGFAFASEVKALLALKTVSRRVNAGPLFQYLALGLTDYDQQTLFADIRQLPPASVVDVDLDTAAISAPRRYWNIPAAVDKNVQFDDAARQLRQLLLESVRLHLRSDVPVGAALSGGIDSSAIVMAMREVGGLDVDIHTFTYAADDPVIGEERWADLVGGAAKVTMHKVRIAPEDLVNDLDRLIEDQDLPFGSTSIYAQHRVFAAAKQANIKVMLDGQGADEMLAGYRHHISARIVSLLRKGEIKAAMALLAQAARLPGGGGLVRTLLRVGAGFAPALSVDATQRRRSARSALDHAWFAERGAVSSVLYGQGRTSLRQALVRDFTQASLPALLRYEDRNSMAHSIESRVPLLTRSIADFVFSLPEGFLIGSDGTGKTVLRAALRGLVPDAVLDRRDKIGFQTPERNWLRHLDSWVTGVIASDVARSVPFLKIDAAVAEWVAVCEGRRSFDWRVWRWLNLIRWSELMQARFE